MEIFFSTVNDSFIRQKFFQVICFLLARHFKTTASSDTDTTLFALKQFDAQNDKNYIFEIPYGSVSG
jgi:hypothetical protein